MAEKLKIALLRASVRLLALLPLSWLQALGRLVGSLAWWRQGRSARITVTNIALCFPALSQPAQRRLARRSLQETAKTLLEMGKAWLAPVPSTLASIHRVREELDVDAALARGKGVIAIVPHLGNWEILNLYAGQRFALNILYQPPRWPALDDFIRGARERVGTQVFPTDRRGVMAMFKALQKGEVVGILPDMEPPEEAGTYAPFYGIEARTMTLISKLAQKSGATVMCAFAKRLPGGQGFEVVLKPACEDIGSPDLQTSVAALNRSIESCVEEAREQYQWEYKRFKHRRGGQKTGYYR